MKKLISISLVLVLAGGLTLAENKKAEAMDPASAALIGASIMLLPLLVHISHEHDYYRPAPYYSGANYDYPYPAQPRVYYNDPRYERYYARNWNRGYDRSRNRERYEDRRGRDYDRDRYADRYYNDRY